jgi:molybdate transport system substrate-binding protein
MQNMHNFMPQQNLTSKASPGLRRRHYLGGMALGLAMRSSWADQPVLRVAAASDLKFVLAQLLETFQNATGLRVEASYGSSGNFARQIRQGLPVHLFMSADESWVLQLAEAGLTRRLPDGMADRGLVYGLGRIALIVPLGSALQLDPELKGLQAGWSRVGKFAIANPEHAPYGRAARQALEKLGVWSLAKTKLVLGENIAQATQFVTTGAAQAGITAQALALAPEVARQVRHILLPENLHQPMRQRMVLLREAPSDARRLYDYLQTAAAQAVFRRYGFAV